jgi:hypothetical protein
LCDLLVQKKPLGTSDSRGASTCIRRPLRASESTNIDAIPARSRQGTIPAVSIPRRR